MRLLEVGETVKGCGRLSCGFAQDSADRRCEAAECSRLGHRAIVIESTDSKRTIVLCGLHFLEACRDCKELECLEWNTLPRPYGLHRAV